MFTVSPKFFDAWLEYVRARKRERFEHFQDVLLRALAYGFDTPHLMFLPSLERLTLPLFPEELD